MSFRPSLQTCSTDLIFFQKLLSDLLFEPLLDLWSISLFIGALKSSLKQTYGPLLDGRSGCSYPVHGRIPSLDLTLTTMTEMRELVALTGPPIYLVLTVLIFSVVLMSIKPKALGTSSRLSSIYGLLAVGSCVHILIRKQT
jgi:hypothetical protein